jgi:hypothetical protein
MIGRGTICVNCYEPTPIQYVMPADDTGYSLDDPKHPRHHDLFSGLAE